ncbi:hypothetical protein [Streptomyces flaveolus]|uniref:hypothetical protein n=1 Tax=Streptomyces flaveolus TaxID=67297 RepID=UPI0033E8DBE3
MATVILVVSRSSGPYGSQGSSSPSGSSRTVIRSPFPACPKQFCIWETSKVRRSPPSSRTVHTMPASCSRCRPATSTTTASTGSPTVRMYPSHTAGPANSVSAKPATATSVAAPARCHTPPTRHVATATTASTTTTPTSVTRCATPAPHSSSAGTATAQVPS